MSMGVGLNNVRRFVARSPPSPIKIIISSHYVPTGGLGAYTKLDGLRSRDLVPCGSWYTKPGVWNIRKRLEVAVGRHLQHNREPYAAAERRVRHALVCYVPVAHNEAATHPAGFVTDLLRNVVVPQCIT
ncbi:hypothetical protein RR46_07475 [Papilio xuthus]|uniref:Uncharacterized protein n=1 Tax=Papilio xuthus TaxID=66420 RepID=A0A194QB36_PAPXU|nr:hypothetical protein RR46_07475 [Papilio xuthus]